MGKRNKIKKFIVDGKRIEILSCYYDFDEYGLTVNFKIGTVKHQLYTQDVGIDEDYDLFIPVFDGTYGGGDTETRIDGKLVDEEQMEIVNAILNRIIDIEEGRSWDITYDLYYDDNIDRDTIYEIENKINSEFRKMGL